MEVRREVMICVFAYMYIFNFITVMFIKTFHNKRISHFESKNNYFGIYFELKRVYNKEKSNGAYYEVRY